MTIILTDHTDDHITIRFDHSGALHLSTVKDRVRVSAMFIGWELEDALDAFRKGYMQ